MSFNQAVEKEGSTLRGERVPSQARPMLPDSVSDWATENDDETVVQPGAVAVSGMDEISAQEVRRQPAPPIPPHQLPEPSESPLDDRNRSQEAQNINNPSPSQETDEGSLPVARPANEESNAKEIDEDRIVEKLRASVIQPLLNAANEAQERSTGGTAQNEKKSIAVSSLPIAKAEEIFESSGKAQESRTRDSRSGGKICGLKSSLFYAVVLGALGIMIVVVGTVVGIAVSNNGKDDASITTQPTGSPSSSYLRDATPAPQNDIMTMSPTDPPTGSPSETSFSERFESLFELLEPFITINGHLLQEETSIQHKALMWLADEDPANLDFDTTSTVILLERYVVVVFYLGTVGVGWREQYNFLSSEPVCEWGGDGASVGNAGVRHGISCISVEGETSIGEIRLQNNILQGELPADLGLLEKIKNLVLGNNFLVGSIPSEIFMVSTLEAIELSENALTGSIPTEVGLLTDSFRYFDVDTNYLTGTVPLGTFAKLSTTLSFLSLNWNTFEEGGVIPTEVGQLSMLTNLGLALSGLTGTIPDELGNCTSMIRFYVPDNQRLYGTIPTSLARMTDLDFFVLWTNELTGTVPTEFVALTKLTRLDLSDTQVTGSVDPIFCEPVRLPSLIYLGFDCLADPPEIVCSCCTNCYDCTR